MSNPIDYLMQGALAGDYARGEEDNRNYRQQQTAAAQDLSERQSNLDDMYVITGLATDLGVTSDASGEEIDKAKLSELWSKNVASGTIDPKLSQLAALLGNEDFAAQKNPGFSFKGARLGPDGTVTLQGGYEGDEGKNRYLTVDREGGDDAEVGFGDPLEISGLMVNQYNQSMNKKGVSGLKRELQLKNDLIDSDQSFKGNNLKINNIVGGLTQELEEMIYSLSPEKAPAIVTKMKRQLAGVPYDQQLAVLQNEGRKLGIPVDEVVPPEVKAAAEAGTPQQEATAAPGTPDNSARIAEIEKALADRSYASGMDGAKTVATKESELKAELASLKGETEPTKEKPALSQAEQNRYKRLLGGAKKNLANAKKSGDKKFIERAQKRVDNFESKLGRGQEETTDGTRAQVLQKSRDEETNPELKKMAEVAETATDEDILEGKVEITQEQIVALQERLKAAGINTLEEMNKASLADQLKMKAALSTIAVNKDQRKTYLERMNNLMATGSADYDTKTLAAAGVAQQNADTSSETATTARLNYFQKIEKHEFDVGEKIGTRIRDNFKAARKAIYGSDSDGNPGETIDFDENRFFSEFGGAFNNAYREYTRAKGTEAKAATKTALNSMMSMGIQALAESEEYGSFGENFIPDGSIDFIDATDSLLSRLKKQADGSVIVVDNNGDQIEESVPKSVLKQIFGNAGYGYFIKEIEGRAGSLKSQQR
jgi:hypothetical protein